MNQLQRAGSQAATGFGDGGMLAQVVGAEVDVQVSTAHRFPRDVKWTIENVKTLALSSREVASSCVYAIPRRGSDGKNTFIQGPSVVLARIVVSCWKNFRAAQRVLGHDGKSVHAQAMAWDLESNVAVQAEVARRITGRNGKTFSDDMIQVTGAAAASIAYRNAVFSVVPRPVWEPVYQRCLALAAGGGAKGQTLEATRAKCLGYLQREGVPLEAILRTAGVEAEADLEVEHIGLLRGVVEGYRNGDVTDLRAAFGVEPDIANGTWREAAPQVSAEVELDAMGENDET